MAVLAKTKALSKKTKIIIGSIAGFIVLIIILAVAFGTPSAEMVFKEMNEEMLKTQSVTIDQTYKGSSTTGDSIDLNTKVYLNLVNPKELSAKGDFDLNMVNGGSPMVVKADFISIGDSTYIKYDTISSSSAELADSFSQVEAKLKNYWIKVRDGDNFASFASIPLDSITNVLPTPFANLNDNQRKSVLTILQDKSTYTVEESSKVKVGGVNAYKYVISYNKDQYDKVAKAISGFVPYFKNSDEDGDQIKSLTVWVDINTKRLIKMEFTGTTSNGDVEGTLVFSGYNQLLKVEKPSDYSIESELLN